VPISVFIRSKAGEAGFPSPPWGEGGCKPDEVGLAGSSACKQRAVASNNVALIEGIFVFIVFLLFCYSILTEFHLHNERAGAGRTAICDKVLNSASLANNHFTHTTPSR
jgi:hypothetical protein